MTALLLDASVARAVGDAVPPEWVVPRRWSATRRRWDPIDASSAVQTMAGVGPAGLVVARSPGADPGAACLWPAAAAFGMVCVPLPPDGDVLGGAVGVALALVRLGAAPAAVAIVVRQITASDGPCPAIRPGALLRWATLRARASVAPHQRDRVTDRVTACAA